MLTETTTKEAIAAIVPVCNEAELVGSTIISLGEQTIPLQKILIVTNNCTDNSAEIARSYQERYPQLEVIELQGNKGKKAGALNHGLDHLNQSGEHFGFILQMDGDTKLHPRICQEALNMFQRDSKLGGVCSRVMPMPPTRDQLGPNIFTRIFRMLMWRLQNIEYGLAIASIIERFCRISVLSGAVTVYRKSVMMEVAARNHQRAIEKIRKRKVRTVLKNVFNFLLGKPRAVVDTSKEESRLRLSVWPEGDLVEDYALTLDIQEMGWKAKIGLKMFSWTDVPLTVPALWKQRKRWNLGTLIQLWLRRAFWNWIAWRERFTQVGFFYEVFSLSVFYTYLGTFIWKQKSFHFETDHPATLIFAIGIPALTIISSMIRSSVISGKDFWQIFCLLIIIPCLLFGLLKQLSISVCYALCFFKPNQEWG